MNKIVDQSLYAAMADSQVVCNVIRMKRYSRRGNREKGQFNREVLRLLHTKRLLSKLVPFNFTQSTLIKATSFGKGTLPANRIVEDQYSWEPYYTT